jgi:hypothetical protein
MAYGKLVEENAFTPCVRSKCNKPDFVAGLKVLLFPKNQ